MTLYGVYTTSNSDAEAEATATERPTEGDKWASYILFLQGSFYITGCFYVLLKTYFIWLSAKLVPLNAKTLFKFP